MAGYLNRFSFEYLVEWANRDDRKPLIIRGARQVGKSTLVMMLAKHLNLELITLDFEQKPQLAELFDSKDPSTIMQLISLETGQSLAVENMLLFLDEIQVKPEILATLRYFYEKLPQLRIIAAGSLLEFSLENPPFSMPVGRIEYMYLGPLTFEEFLMASNEKPLVEFLSNYEFGEDYPDLIHQKLMLLLKKFFVVGGMPNVIKQYILKSDFIYAEREKHSILSTYQDDFSKYTTRAEENKIREVFEKIVNFIACKIQYSKINPDVKSVVVAEALKKLALAKIIYLVQHSSCNGVPLGAEVNEKIFKPLFLDIGLLSTQLHLNLLDLVNVAEVDFVNNGVLAEQFIGQHLLYQHPYYQEPYLYYWQREKQRAQAEIDYVISIGQHIFPIEVKAGKTGTLKSLHTFLKEKKISLGVRLNSEKPCLSQKNSEGHTILSLPLYMVGQVSRILSGTLFDG
jgi:predicted AAA+ superfamily ATPase